MSVNSNSNSNSTDWKTIPSRSSVRDRFSESQKEGNWVDNRMKKNSVPVNRGSRFSCLTDQIGLKEIKSLAPKDEEFPVLNPSNPIPMMKSPLAKTPSLWINIVVNQPKPIDSTSQKYHSAGHQRPHQQLTPSPNITGNNSQPVFNRRQAFNRQQVANRQPVFDRQQDSDDIHEYESPQDYDAESPKDPYDDYYRTHGLSSDLYSPRAYDSDPDI
jgi:hypothetical protein